MFYLTNRTIVDNIDALLCSYHDNQKCNEIIYHNDLCLQTFTVAEKIVYDEFCFDKVVYKELQEKYKDIELLYFRDISTEDWIKGMILDQVEKITEYTVEEKNDIIECVYKNALTLLKCKLEDRYICEDIYNQEFVDILRNVIIYSIFGDFEHFIDTAKVFNDLADKIIPHILKRIELENFDLKYIFKLSIASGMSGLDMKGAPAASSAYANSGIGMRNYLNMELDDVLEDYFKKLCNICNTSTTPCFDWEILEQKIGTCKRLMWFTDDYIESFFDLYFIQKIMSMYSICVEIVPKNGVYGNDMSWMNLLNIINNLEIFKELEKYMLEGRLLINKNGPKMAAINLRKLSNRLVESIENTDFCVLKGCRIHEMIQGNINAETFSSYIVSRELSEIVTGFNSHEYPILLIYLEPGEFAYWGINGLEKNMKLSDGREISTIYSPLIQHINRKNICNIEYVIKEFNDIKAKLKFENQNQRKIFQELNLLGEKLINNNCKVYNQFASQYSAKRKVVSAFEKQQWDKLEKIFFEGKNTKKQAQQKILLDAGTGNGRDLLYAKKLGYRVFGIDYSEKFYKMLLNLEEEGKIERGSCRLGDLRNLPWEENTFDIVRQNATILHFPIIDVGYGADKVIAESYRVLKEGGVLYVSVKEGDGLVSVDTGEGLGMRVYQLFSQNILQILLERNGFRILSIENIDEARDDNIIKWIVVIAVKGEVDVNRRITKVTSI